MRHRGLLVLVLLTAVGEWCGAITMSVSIHKRSDNSADTQITWASVTLPAAWLLADHYVEINSSMTTPSDGVQIYTDNLASDANPKYSGVISSVTQTPAGLINTALTSQKLPTAWRITDFINNGGAPPVTPVDPNFGGEGFLWLYHEDRSQVQNIQGAGNFQDGDPYITIEDANCLSNLIALPCIHFAQAPSEFGLAYPPNYVYLEADFRQALPGSIYKTSTLRIEAFTQ